MEMYKIVWGWRLLAELGVGVWNTSFQTHRHKYHLHSSFFFRLIIELGNSQNTQELVLNKEYQEGMEEELHTDENSP